MLCSTPLFSRSKSESFEVFVGVASPKSLFLVSFLPPAFCPHISVARFSSSLPPTPRKLSQARQPSFRRSSQRLLHPGCRWAFPPSLRLSLRLPSPLAAVPSPSLPSPPPAWFANTTISNNTHEFYGFVTCSSAVSCPATNHRGRHVGCSTAITIKPFLRSSWPVSLCHILLMDRKTQIKLRNYGCCALF